MKQSQLKQDLEILIQGKKGLEDNLKKQEGKLKKLIDTFGEDDDIIRRQKMDIEIINKEVATKVQEIEQTEKLISLSDKDWSVGTSPIVKAAYESTLREYSKLSFSKNEAVNGALRQTLASAHPDQIFTILEGQTGSGKTSAVKWVGGEINRPVISQNFSNGMEETDIIGGPVIDATGKVRMVDGPLSEAVRFGCIYVAEEMNFAKPGVIGILNSLLDGNQQVVLPSGEILKAAPGFKFVGTMNFGYEGTRDMNIALINRAGTIIKMDRPTNNAIKNIVKSRTGFGKTKDELIMLERLMIFMTTTEFTISKGSYEAAISVRQIIAAVRHLQNGGIFTTAVRYGIINQVSNFDKDLSRKLVTISEKVRSKPDADFNVNKDGTIDVKTQREEMKIPKNESEKYGV